MISFEDVSFTYGQTPVLEGASFAIGDAGLVVLAGETGAGKSTIVRLCHLELWPNRGQIRLWGEVSQPRDERAAARLRRRMGVVPEESRLIERLNIAENIELPMTVTGGRRRERDLMELIEWIGLGGREHEHPSTLTAAETRRAALARALIVSPELLLLDEPLSGLDPGSAADLLSLLLDLQTIGRPIVLASRDPDLTDDLRRRASARVLTLASGRVVEDAP
ncbi:MAG: ATP-binding cassette domain-containing protein [Pseudomonadota bacterium]